MIIPKDEENRQSQHIKVNIQRQKQTKAYTTNEKVSEQDKINTEKKI